MLRGDVFRLPAPPEQRGARFCVVVQSDDFLPFRTVLVAPTSTRARPASFRPAIDLEGTPTRILVEQATVVDPQRLGDFAGRLDADERRAVDAALLLILGL